MRKYVMLVEWNDWRINGRYDNKANFSCYAEDVDEAICKARTKYSGTGICNLTITNIYAE